MNLVRLLIKIFTTTQYNPSRDPRSICPIFHHYCCCCCIINEKANRWLDNRVRKKVVKEEEAARDEIEPRAFARSLTLWNWISIPLTRFIYCLPHDGRVQVRPIDSSSSSSLFSIKRCCWLCCFIGLVRHRHHLQLFHLHLYRC